MKLIQKKYLIFNKWFLYELLKYRKNIQNKMVDREESTKLSFDWNDHIILKELKKKIENVIGKFSVNDFEPHFITTRFPQDFMLIPVKILMI